MSWRGAVITGQHPAAHRDEVEAAWQTAMAQNGATHDPTGWTVVLEAGFTPDCPIAQCDGVTIPGRKTVEVSTQGPPASHPTEEILTFEFCHVVLLQRGGNGLGPNCPV